MAGPPDDPEYLERVRRATAGLRLRNGDAGVDAALAAVHEASTIDVDPPLVAEARGVRAVKAGVKSLAGWYLRYLGNQVTVLGRAVGRLGDALAERSEELGRRTDDLRRDVDRLAERVDRLEPRDGAGA